MAIRFGKARGAALSVRRHPGGTGCLALGSCGDPLEQTRPRCIALDLRELDFIDSSGLRQLLAARRRAKRAARRLVLIGGDAAIQRLFALAGLRDAFEMASDVPAEQRVEPAEQL